MLSVLGIVLAFPLSVLLALARLSPWRVLRWPATALVYIMRGVPLLMIILWVYFLRAAADRARRLRASSTMLCTLVIYEGAFLSRSGARRHPGAAARDRPKRPARSATAISARCAT